ncbi:hypothetical protein Y1Q_0012367 [Alligator mississippiensis]|uniref:Uncharacterized protein n=1 Tax=Alligator mississippiensis TaxID=8496 RepID=A0A151MRU7_ALLMI|nr:hypothetical protein Y1Q_0012367 [Alligator mississippiensis]
MSLALKARQKVRRKGAAKDRVFGCDLLEHLQQSGQEGLYWDPGPGLGDRARLDNRRPRFRLAWKQILSK